QSARRPAKRPWRLILPCAILVRMLATFEPSSSSTACLIWILFACGATSKTIVRPSSRMMEVFSVMSGRRITSVSFIKVLILPIADRSLQIRQQLAEHVLKFLERALGRDDTFRVGDVPRRDA